MVTTISRRRFNTHEYDRMGEIGIIHNDSNVELLDGIVYEKYPADGDAPRPYRFTASEYAQMTEAGILTGDDRVELMNGEITTMSAQGHRHVWCVLQLTNLLRTMVVPRDLFISVQCAIRVGDASVPEPDIALIYRHEFRRVVLTTDLFLVIEISDSTLARDQNEKMPLYAAAGIPEMWIVDLTANAIAQYTTPQSGSYQHIAHARPGEILTSVVVPTVRIAVADILN